MKTMLRTDGSFETCVFFGFGDNEPGEGFVSVDGVHNGETHFWNGSAVQERPAVAAPAEACLSVGQELSIPGLPDGTQVFIDGELLGETDGDLVVEFPEPMVCEMLLAPPLPYARHTCKVVVS